jgi:4-amino-4-deoxychorismate lyase
MNSLNPQPFQSTFYWNANTLNFTPLTADFYSYTALGDGVFTTLKAQSQPSRLIFAQDHWIRLQEHACAIGIQPPNSSFIFPALNQLLDSLPTCDYRLRLALYANQGWNEPGHLIVQLSPLSFSTKPLNVGLINPSLYSVTPTPLSLKSTSYGIHLKLKRWIETQNWDEAILQNFSNHLCEALYSNLFLIKDNQLYTPSIDQPCLNGIIRKKIMTLALSKKISCYESSIHTDQLKSYQAVFLTNSLRGIQPISTINQIIFDPQHPIIHQLTADLSTLEQR